MFEKHLATILKEMCKRVDADFEKVNFKSKTWYSKCSWTEAEQNDFKKWLVKYLKKNSEARREMMENPTTISKIIDKFANMFIFNYGWKTEEE